MLVEQIWTGNSLRNFNYLLACERSGEAVAIDPLDYEKCLNAARARGWQITQIVNTHEHNDHIDGNPHVVSATGAKVLAHARADIPDVDVGLSAGDAVTFGEVSLRVLDTPGHTMSHVCLMYEGESPALFCGDTLFNAGAGNCHNGGHPQELYDTFIQQLAKLPDATRIYPGHDYLESNLKFTLDREPNNQAAFELLDDKSAHDPNNALVTTLAREKEINTFFRLQNPEVIDQLRTKFPEIGERPDRRTVFLKLRELRNQW